MKKNIKERICVYIYMYIYVYMYIYICINICVYIYICIIQSFCYSNGASRVAQLVKNLPAVWET